MHTRRLETRVFVFRGAPSPIQYAIDYHLVEVAFVPRPSP